MKNKELFEIAVKYIEKGYNMDNLRDGDDLYEATSEEEETCCDYFDRIKENGLKWAREFKETL